MSYLVRTPTQSIVIPANWSIRIGRRTYFFRWWQKVYWLDDVIDIYVK